jgi:hypothetical protein
MAKPARNRHETRTAHALTSRAPRNGAETEGPDVFMNTQETSELTRISKHQLEKGRSLGIDLPPFIRVSHKKILYSRNAVLRWMYERTYRSTSEYPREA